MFFASKSLGLINGYAIDDYSFWVAGKGEFQGLFLSQGRFTDKIIQDAIDLSDLRLPHFAVLGFLLHIAGVVVVAWVTLRGWLRQNLFLTIALGSLLGSHSFFSEIVSFRMGLFLAGLGYAVTAAAVVVYDLEWTRNSIRLLTTTVLIVIAMGINQLMFPFFVVAILGISVKKYTSRSFFRLILNTCRDLTQICGIVLIVYLLIFLSTSLGSRSDRTLMLSSNEVANRLYDIARLLKVIFEGSSPVIGPISAVGTNLAFLMLIIRVTKQKEKWLQVVLGLLTFGLGVAIAMSPIAFSKVWWPMPRTLIVLPLVIALGIAILSTGTSKVQIIIASGSLLIASVFLSGKSAELLLDQQRLNRWDMGLARDILLKIAEVTTVDNSTTIVIHRYAWAYPLDTNMPIGDANTSSMAVVWAVEGLFEEASGRRLNVRLAPNTENTCNSAPSFPASGSIIKINSTINVCL